MVAGIQAGQAQNVRPFGELFVHCEIKAMASRIGNAVMHIFQIIADFFQSIGRFILNGCSHQVTPNSMPMGNPPAPGIPANPADEQRNALIAEVTEIIANSPIPADEREAMLAHALPLVNERMNRWDKTDIVAKVTEIPAQEREAATRLALLFITPDMNVWSIKEMIDTVVAVPAQDREVVIPLAHPLIVEGNRWDMPRIFQAVAAIPVPDRETVIPLARQVILEGMPGEHMQIIFEAIVGVPTLERETLIAHTLPLITGGMTRWDRQEIIQAVAAVPALEREVVTACARQMITEAMDGVDARALIEAVVAIPALQREAVIAHALPLITEGMTRWDRRDIIQAIIAVPVGQRDDVMRHALDLITPQMFGFTKIRIIQDVAAVPANGRANFVNNRRLGIQNPPPVFNPPPMFNPPPVFNPPPMFNPPINPVNFADGINIHNGNRDHLTLVAMETLCRHQGPIDALTLTQAKDNFIAYLDASVAFNAQEKQLARNALNLRGGIFEPLFDGEYRLPDGSRLTGIQLIGRLWIFASGLNGNEVINAKDGMISALKNSYGDWGDVVCNDGKAQRLVIAVLQGRLAGVNIEGNMVPLEVTREDATRMFFNIPAHTAIDNLADLLVAANRFCDENPGVNRANFIEDMNTHARLTFEDEDE